MCTWIFVVFVIEQVYIYLLSVQNSFIFNRIAYSIQIIHIYLFRNRHLFNYYCSSWFFIYPTRVSKISWASFVFTLIYVYIFYCCYCVKRIYPNILRKYIHKHSESCCRRETFACDENEIVLVFGFLFVYARIYMYMYMFVCNSFAYIFYAIIAFGIKTSISSGYASDWFSFAV